MKYLFILLFLTVQVFSSTIYVRDGDTGNGSAWDNALDQIPSPITRGDTVFLADGSYTGYNFDDGLSGSTYIYIHKATESAHGSSTGWSSAYGDGVAIFTTRWDFATGYWDIDGIVGSGTSGHGFRIDINSGTNVKHIYSVSGADYVKIRHTEMEGVGEDRENNSDDILYLLGTSTNWELSYCWLHDVNRTCMITLNVTQFTLEYCVLERRHTNGSTHGELISINSSGNNAEWVIRYNRFSDCAGTGFVVIKDAVQGGFKIYGNIFYSTSSRYNVSNGALCNTSGDTNNDMEVYNNTFYNITTIAVGGVSWSGSGTGNITYNNLFHTIENCGFNGQAHDYNWFYNSGSQSETNMQNGASNVFTNSATFDLSLAYATDEADNTIGAEYNTDLNGSTRGSDGSWDRGAFEYTEGGAPPVGGGQSGEVIQIGDVTY